MKPLDAAARASRPEFDVHLTENVMVPMRDGVRLATDVYCPARDGRVLADRRPVLLHRTPYNKVETEATSSQSHGGSERLAHRVLARADEKEWRPVERVHRAWAARCSGCLDMA